MRIVTGRSSVINYVPDASEQMRDIWSQRMNSDYIDREVLNSKYIVAAIDGDTIAGFAGGKITGLRDVHKELVEGNLSNRFGDCVNDTGQAGLLSIVAIRRQYENQGLGKQLSSKITEMLTGQAGIVFGEAWIRSGKTDGSDLLRTLGFQIIYQSDRYWKPKTDDSYLPCPECGDSPCQCSGALYYKAR